MAKNGHFWGSPGGAEKGPDFGILKTTPSYVFTGPPNSSIIWFSFATPPEGPFFGHFWSKNGPENRRPAKSKPLEGVPKVNNRCHLCDVTYAHRA